MLESGETGNDTAAAAATGIDVTDGERSTLTPLRAVGAQDFRIVFADALEVLP